MVVAAVVYFMIAEFFFVSTCHQDAKSAPVNWTFPAINLIAALIWPVTLLFGLYIDKVLSKQ